MKKLWRISEYTISIFLGLLIVYLIFKYFRVQKIEYKGNKIELRNSENGIMFFGKYNSGEFSIESAYESKNSIFFLNLYSFQKKNYHWVKVQDLKMVDIDSSKYVFSSFTEINVKDLNFLN